MTRKKTKKLDRNPNRHLLPRGYMSECARLAGVSRQAIDARVDRGWPLHGLHRSERPSVTTTNWSMVKVGASRIRPQACTCRRRAHIAVAAAACLSVQPAAREGPMDMTAPTPKTPTVLGVKLKKRTRGGWVGRIPITIGNARNFATCRVEEYSDTMVSYGASLRPGSDFLWMSGAGVGRLRDGIRTIESYLREQVGLRPSRKEKR